MTDSLQTLCGPRHYTFSSGPPCRAQQCRKYSCCQAPLKRQQPDATVSRSVKRRAAEDSGSAGDGTGLEAIIRRKRKQLSEVLREYSEEDLYNRLGGSEFGELSEQGSEYRFAGLIPQVKFQQGRPVLVFELTKPSPASTSAELAELAQKFEAAGADALAVPTDLIDTSTGLADLLSIREAKEAGAAGVMGIIASVLGEHAFVLSSYAASLGLDCPVEVVNADELSRMETLDVPFIGCNLGVGLSLALPGFRSDIATGLLGKTGQGTVTMVGATSLEEAVKAREAGADAVFVKKEWLSQALKQGSSSEQAAQPRRPESSKVIPEPALVDFMQNLKYATGGDD